MSIGYVKELNLGSKPKLLKAGCTLPSQNSGTLIVLKVLWQDGAVLRRHG